MLRLTAPASTKLNSVTIKEDKLLITQCISVASNATERMFVMEILEIFHVGVIRWRGDWGEVKKEKSKGSTFSVQRADVLCDLLN